jgi:hypothetical protein
MIEQHMNTTHIPSFESFPEDARSEIVDRSFMVESNRKPAEQQQQQTASRMIYIESFTLASGRATIYLYHDSKSGTDVLIDANGQSMTKL